MLSSMDCLLTEDVSVLLPLSAKTGADLCDGAGAGAGATGASPPLGAALPVISSVLNAFTSMVARAVAVG